MLRYGRERAAAAGLENVEFVESEAAGLDFPAASFDAALSRFGIIFEPEAEATAGRVWNAILEAVEARASDDGTVKFSNLVLLAVGRA